jgi:hypothetical protein
MNMRLFQGSEETFLGFLMDSLDLTDEPHPTFLVQGHILNIGGDALSGWGWTLMDHAVTSFHYRYAHDI